MSRDQNGPLVAAAEDGPCVDGKLVIPEAGNSAAELMIAEGEAKLLAVASSELAIDVASLSVPAGLEEAEEWGPQFHWYGGKIIETAGDNAIVLYVDLMSGQVVRSADYLACRNELVAEQGTIAHDVAATLSTMVAGDTLTVAVSASGIDRSWPIAEIQKRYPDAMFIGGRPHTDDDDVNMRIMRELRQLYQEAATAATMPIVEAALAAGAKVEYASRYAPMVWITADAATIRALSLLASVGSIDSSGTLAPESFVP